MGSDLIKSLHWWEDGERLINEGRFIVFLRKGFNNEELFEHANFPKNDPIIVDETKSLIGVISSTEIRNRVCANQDSPFFGIAGLVTPKVIDYIRKSRLYINPSFEVDLLVNDKSPIVVRDNSTASNSGNAAINDTT